MHSLRSSPRKRGPRATDRGPWMPSISAFTRVFDALCAGMSGVFGARLAGVAWTEGRGCRAAHSVRELERDHAGDDERGAEPAPQARGVAEKPHPHEEGSGGADAGPHRVGGAERDVPLRQKEQAAADRERDDRYRRADDGPPRLLRPLEPDRPADLAQSGDNQICPGDRHVSRPLPLRFAGTIAKDDSRFVTARRRSGTGVAAPVGRGSAAPPAILPRHAQVARLIVNNNPETMKPPRRTAPTTTGWSPPSRAHAAKLAQAA